MNSRYNLINDCLEVLRQCDIPAIPKLRLEVQLFQIKLLLLGDQVGGDIKGRYCSEGVLLELHRQMVELRDGETTYGSVEKVRIRLQQVAHDLAEAGVSVPASPEG